MRVLATNPISVYSLCAVQGPFTDSAYFSISEAEDT